MEGSVGIYLEKQEMLTGQRTGRDVCISDICTSRSFDTDLIIIFYSSGKLCANMVKWYWGKKVINSVRMYSFISWK